MRLTEMMLVRRRGQVHHVAARFAYRSSNCRLSCRRFVRHCSCLLLGGIIMVKLCLLLLIVELLRRLLLLLLRQFLRLRLLLLLLLLVVLTECRLKLSEMWLRLLGLLLRLLLRLLVRLLLVCCHLGRLLLLLLLLQLTTIVLCKILGETHGRRTVIHLKCFVRCNVANRFAECHSAQETVKHLLLLVKQGLRLVLCWLLLLLLLLRRSLFSFLHFIGRISTVIHTHFLSRSLKRIY